MGTKNDPGKYDCYANAEPDEPMFILLGRDPAASFCVSLWMILREDIGANTEDDQQIKDAGKCVSDMVAYATRLGKSEQVAKAFFACGKVMEIK